MERTDNTDTRCAKRTNPKIKPAVDKRVLLLLAGLLWLCVGTLLLSSAFSWIGGVNGQTRLIIAGGGIIAALIIHHLGLLKVVDKNLGRILPMEGKRCAFSFMSWKSYLMAGAMAGMGALLRHSEAPKSILAAVYIAMGLALALSSVRYFRFFIISRQDGCEGPENIR